VKKRATTEEERREFKDALAEARPLGRSVETREALPARGASSGIDGRTAKKLRQGELEPDARLDLHGFTQESAHRTLSNFVTSCRSRGLRLVLVVTGGVTSPVAGFDLGFGRAPRGVLRNLVPRWLRESGMAGHVLATQTANRRHGGDGALYVYLRKRLP